MSRNPPVASASRPLELRLFADFSQIHLVDDAWSGSFEDAWTAQATEDRVAVADGGIAIGTRDADDVPVTVERLDRAPVPHEEEGAADHVTEASVGVPSGKLVVMGCTDSFPDARRLAVGTGTYRVRVSHTGLAKGKERIAVHMWPAPMASPQVLKRWVAAPKVAAPPPTRPPRNARKAAEYVRAGHLTLALPVLEKQADAGNVEASLSLAHIHAFRRDDEGVVRRGLVLFEHPETFGAINPFQEMGQLVGRALRRIAARDPGDPVKALADAAHRLQEIEQRLPAHFRRGRPLFEDADDGSDAVAEKADPEKLAGYQEWLARPQTAKDFAGHPDKLLRHAFAIASDCLEDEVLRLWADPGLPRTFKEAVSVARWLAFRGKSHEAWAALEPNLSTWWPLFYYQLGPVELLYDRFLGPLLTPERCEQILVTPRGSEAS
jgi:hypothetical protein